MTGEWWLLPNGEGWIDQAVCSQTDVELWFPERGQSNIAAKAICRTCPVTAQCLEFAMRTDQRFGVWGGLSETERRNLARRRRRNKFVPHVAAQNREHAAYMKARRHD